MILVTGATGNIGSMLVPSLIAQDASVRALIRKPSEAQGLREAGVEVVAGDLERPETLDAAFSGVRKVFLLTPPNPHQVPRRSTASLPPSAQACRISFGSRRGEYPRRRMRRRESRGSTSRSTLR